VTEITFALAGIGITISRLKQDLHLWYSHEFGFLDISDDIAGTSSIMPQKKNPMPIEHLKAKSGHILGALTASLAVLKGTGFMHCREVNGEMMQPLGHAAREAEAMLRLADAVLRGLRVDAARMLATAGATSAPSPTSPTPWCVNTGFHFARHIRSSARSFAKLWKRACAEPMESIVRWSNGSSSASPDAC
jgi:argininosuccinate lyase